MSDVYSAAPEAATKKRLDEKIRTGSYPNIDMTDELYLKELIQQASDGKKSVSSTARGLQFFIIKGGGEGFLDSAYKGKNASRMVSGSKVTTNGKPGTMMIFDDNDLIAVFDRKGKLLSSALLSRPISIAVPDDPNFWTEGTANKVYDAWDGQPVSMYYNKHFLVEYYGLWVNDSLGLYVAKKKWVRIDIHKEEQTNGCIFIKDPNTPPVAETVRLNAFEPQFIRDVQKSVGRKTQYNIGTMHMVDIP